jgi:hypothetical protein
MQDTAHLIHNCYFNPYFKGAFAGCKQKIANVFDIPGLALTGNGGKI